MCASVLEHKLYIIDFVFVFVAYFCFLLFIFLYHVVAFSLLDELCSFSGSLPHVYLY